MNNGNLSDKLVEFCRIFFGRVKGGLAYMNVLTACFRRYVGLFTGGYGKHRFDYD